MNRPGQWIVKIKNESHVTIEQEYTMYSSVCTSAGNSVMSCDSTKTISTGKQW